jgi:hypothetical protein
LRITFCPCQGLPENHPKSKTFSPRKSDLGRARRSIPACPVLQRQLKRLPRRHGLRWQAQRDTAFRAARNPTKATNTPELGAAQPQPKERGSVSRSTPAAMEANISNHTLKFPIDVLWISFVHF